MQIYMIDAFSNAPFSGNPAAVCIVNEPLDDSLMQKIAAEMNLSETAFLLKQNNAYQLRWFTPKAEVELCGHATLASAHILWETKLESEDQEIKFNTLSGMLTTTKKKSGWIDMDFPIEEDQECVPPKELFDGLKAKVEYSGKNRFDYMVEVDSEETLRNLKPDFNLLKKVQARGIIVTSTSKEFDFISRCFYPALGVNEDPVTGSAHCCLAAYWKKKLGKDYFIACQESERRGIVKIQINGNRVILSGQARTVLKGEIML